jgi:hypothetical protein
MPKPREWSSRNGGSIIVEHQTIYGTKRTVVETVREVLPEDSAWPVKDVLTKLVEAAEILLHRYDYDGHGYEEILAAVNAAKQIAEASE